MQIYSDSIAGHKYALRTQKVRNTLRLFTFEKFLPLDYYYGGRGQYHSIYYTIFSKVFCLSLSNFTLPSLLGIFCFIFNPNIVSVL